MMEHSARCNIGYEHAKRHWVLICQLYHRTVHHHSQQQQQQHGARLAIRENNIYYKHFGFYDRACYFWAFYWKWLFYDAQIC